jgi:hypothetical protein
MSGTYQEYQVLIHQLMPTENELVVNLCHIICESSREITLSHDATAMQHELFHHFVQALSRNGDHGHTHNTLQTDFMQIRETHRLHLAEITHSHVLSAPAAGPLGLVPPTPIDTAAQMHPHWSPQNSNERCQPTTYGSTDRWQHHPRSAPDTINCELCLDRFKFPSHDTPWCPLLHE